MLSDLQKLINQVVLIDYTIIILGGEFYEKTWKKVKLDKKSLQAYAFVSALTVRAHRVQILTLLNITILNVRQNK